MANTYTLISSSTLGSNQTSVTFSSIPSTYTDLVLIMSVRAANSSGNPTMSPLIRFNGDTATNYSYTELYTSNGTSAASFRASSQTAGDTTFNGTTTTANTFSNTELYIPNYTVSANKPFSMYTVAENNATAGYIYTGAELWRNTATINSIALVSYNGVESFATGSSFYLYGIKNS